MSDRDYYEILGLTPRADGAMVDAAYWHLVRKYQQLAATNPRAQRLIDELNEAYGVLGNPRLRKQYDAFRDDVLVQSGMIRPVTSKPKRKANDAKDKPAQAQSKPARRSRDVRLPEIRIKHGRTYALSAVIALLAFAAAWQGVHIVLVTLALAAGLALALSPTVGRRIGEIRFEMPSLPAVDLTQVKAPRVNLSEIGPLRDLAAREEPAVDADTLRRSTAQTIARWRQSVGLRVSVADPVSEDVEDLAVEVEDQSEDTAPLDAVINILRNGASRTATR